MEQTISDFISGRKAIVVEDEVAISQLLKINLGQQGFDVTVCNDAESAFVKLQQSDFDLCLLDWMLPGIQGVDFLKKIRPQHKALKVMMVTAKADSESIVTGLEAGADDYLSKPFDAKVLAARVRHLMRRLQFEKQMQEASKATAVKTAPEFPDHFSFAELEIHFSRHTVSYQSSDVHLTPSEFKLLSALVKAQGQVLTRDQLIALIQGEDVTVTGRTIDTHIFALRKKIGAWSQHIETIRGVGYRILISTSDTTEPEA